MAISFTLLMACIGSVYSTQPALVNLENAGRQFVYAYSSEGVGYSDIQMLYNTDSTLKGLPFFYRPTLQTTKVNIHCKIKKTIVNVTHNRRQLCFEILEPIIQIQNNALPVDVAMIMNEITKPVFVYVDNNGKILSVKTDNAVSYLTAGIVKNILSNIQIVMPDERKNNWQVIEENAIGFYHANYRVVNNNQDSIEYQKTNLGYENVPSAKIGQKYFPETNTTIVTNASGLIERINTSESLVTLFGNDTIVASGSSTTY